MVSLREFITLLGLGGVLACIFLQPSWWVWVPFLLITARGLYLVYCKPEKEPSAEADEKEDVDLYI